MKTLYLESLESVIQDCVYLFTKEKGFADCIKLCRDRGLDADQEHRQLSRSELHPISGVSLQIPE